MLLTLKIIIVTVGLDLKGWTWREKEADVTGKEKRDQRRRA